MKNKEKTTQNQPFLDKIGRFFSKILSLIFVPKCVVCEDVLWEDGEMCPECLQLWQSARLEKCPICKKSAQKCTCGTKNLLNSQTVGELGLCALTFYGKPDSEDARDDLVRRMTRIIKTSPDRRIIRFIAREMSAEIIRHFKKSGEDLSLWHISYPPRTSRRIRQYGFDQGRQLARQLSEFTGIPCVALFKRSGSTVQKTLSSAQRKKNADKSIALLKEVFPPCKNVIIVDDIITTGATVNACRELLLAHGVENVFFACFARTKPKKFKVRRTPADKVWFKNR